MSVEVMGIVWRVAFPTTTLKLVTLKLADCANDDGENIYPSVGRIERETGCSVASVREALRLLEGAGLLEVVEERNGNRWNRSTTIRRFDLARLHLLAATRQPDGIMRDADHVLALGQESVISSAPGKEGRPVKRATLKIVSRAAQNDQGALDPRTSRVGACAGAASDETEQGGEGDEGRSGEASMAPLATPLADGEDGSHPSSHRRGTPPATGGVPLQPPEGTPPATGGDPSSHRTLTINRTVNEPSSLPQPPRRARGRERDRLETLDRMIAGLRTPGRERVVDRLFEPLARRLKIDAPDAGFALGQLADWRKLADLDDEGLAAVLAGLLAARDVSVKPADVQRAVNAEAPLSEGRREARNALARQQAVCDPALAAAWNEVRDELGRIYGRPVFDAWLASLVAVGLRGTTVTIAAPDRFKARYVTQDYGHRIEALLRALLPDVRRVDIVVAP